MQGYQGFGEGFKPVDIAARFLLSDLPDGVTEEELNGYFQTFGDIEDVTLKIRPTDNALTGSVKFSNPTPELRHQMLDGKHIIRDTQITVETWKMQKMKRPSVMMQAMSGGYGAAKGWQGEMMSKGYCGGAKGYGAGPKGYGAVAKGFGGAKGGYCGYGNFVGGGWGVGGGDMWGGKASGKTAYASNVGNMGNMAGANPNGPGRGITKLLKQAETGGSPEAAALAADAAAKAQVAAKALAEARMAEAKAKAAARAAQAAGATVDESSSGMMVGEEKDKDITSRYLLVDLDPSINEEHIREYFSVFGEIEEVSLKGLAGGTKLMGSVKFSTPTAELRNIMFNEQHIINDCPVVVQTWKMQKMKRPGYAAKMAAMRNGGKGGMMMRYSPY